MMAGVSMVHVPYRGDMLALTDLMTGRVQVMFANVPETIEFIRAGRLQALAVATAKGLAGAAGNSFRGRRSASL